MIAKSLFAALTALLILPPAAWGQTAPEYSVKASYIARFADFIEWPEAAAEEETSQAFVVSVIGDAPFRDIFERTFAALKIKNRQVEIRHISSIEESEGSQILFVSHSERRKLDKIIAFTRDKPILTISDTDGFANRGVILNFYRERKKILFEINPSASEETGLRISSLLLNSARIVDPEEDEK